MEHEIENRHARFRATRKCCDKRCNAALIHSTPTRIGSPAVNSSSNLRKFVSTSGLLNIRHFLPPPFFGFDLLSHPILVLIQPSLCVSFLDQYQRALKYNQSLHDLISPDIPHLSKAIFDLKCSPLKFTKGFDYKNLQQLQLGSSRLNSRNG